MLTVSHEVGNCALFAAGLKKVEVVNIMGAARLFSAKLREICSAILGHNLKCQSTLVTSKPS